MTKYFKNFKKPGFLNDNKKLTFDVVIMTTTNFFWGLGYSMHPYIIFLCMQHMVNEYHLQIK